MIYNNYLPLNSLIYTSTVTQILLGVLIVLYWGPQLSTFTTLSGLIKPKLILYLVELWTSLPPPAKNVITCISNSNWRTKLYDEVIDDSSKECSTSSSVANIYSFIEGSRSECSSEDNADVTCGNILQVDNFCNSNESLNCVLDDSFVK